MRPSGLRLECGNPCGFQPKLLRQVLQQSAFSDTDATTQVERQRIMFDIVEKALSANYGFAEKAETRKFFMDLQQTFIDWNDKPMNTPEFEQFKDSLVKKIAAAAK